MKLRTKQRLAPKIPMTIKAIARLERKRRIKEATSGESQSKVK
jgi:hypothetical protein